MKNLKASLEKLSHGSIRVFSQLRNGEYPWVKGFIITFLVVFVLYFSSRHYLLHWGIQKANNKLQGKSLRLDVSNAYFSGITSITLEKLQIVHQGESADTLLLSDTIQFRLAPLWGIFGQGWIQDVSVHYADIRYNPGLKFGEDDESIVEDTSDETFGSNPLKIFDWGKRFLQELPNNLNVSALRFQYLDEGDSKITVFEDFTWEDEVLLGKLITSVHGERQVLQVKGALDPESLKGNIHLKSLNKEPFSYTLFGGVVAFKEVFCSIVDVTEKNQQLAFQVEGDLSHLFLNYSRLSDTLIQIDHLKGRSTITFKPGFLEIDSLSQWQLNKLTFLAGAQWPLHHDQGIKWGVFKIPKDQGLHVFESLPAGLFKNTHGIETMGTFGHRFFAWVDPLHLDQTRLEADVEYSKDFKVTQWGAADPKMINGSFLHDHYQDDRLVASFVVGPSNAFYTPITEISPLLIESTLRAEDPSYFGHKGFYLEAFEEALKANLREKRFARGGSTIPMQLVKNVYLNQHKTLARKIEEIILVWLIEHERAVSKQRMLEVYFNLIEWGPGIFGVGSASRFYFGKHPSQLNMGESCYLSSLIPAPRKAIWSVDSTGSVSPRWSRYTKLKNRIISLDSTRFSEEDFQIKVKAFGGF
jgi:hypothetical protein